jgi:hypothetical protein
MEANHLKSFVVKALANTVLMGGPILPRYTQDIQGDVSGTTEVNVWRYQAPAAAVAAAEPEAPSDYIVITIPYKGVPGVGMASRLPRGAGRR